MTCSTPEIIIAQADTWEVDSEDGWDSEDEQRHERLSRLAREIAMREEAKQQIASMDAYRQVKLDRDALDAELARLKQDAGGRHGDDMPRFYRDREYTTSRTSCPEQTSTADLRTWIAHHARWQRFEALPPSSITADTVPWPPDSTKILAAMVAVDLQGRCMHPQDGCCSEAAAWRRAFRVASLHWHPDKFLARYGASMAEADRAAVMARVHLICQSINEQWRERAVYRAGVF